jgi:hypothetical protein
MSESAMKVLDSLGIVPLLSAPAQILGREKRGFVFHEAASTEDIKRKRRPS